ncbi:MAG: fibronectin type III domain-containing protein, partial [Eubacteriales bacterium]
MFTIKHMIVLLLILCIIALGTACSAQTPGLQTQPSESAVQNASTETSAASTAAAKSGKTQKADKGEGKNKNTAGSAVPSTDADFDAPTIVTRPTDTTVTLNIDPAAKMDFTITYGKETGNYTVKTQQTSAESGVPKEVMLPGLEPNTRYYYVIQYQIAGADTKTSQEHSFMTQRSQGSTFTFDLQGDSHPERAQQFDSGLYKITMQNVLKDEPDFYLTSGDDFSVDTMKTITQPAVSQLYINQRQYLGQIGASAPVFLVNGNHEQAAQYVLNGTPDNAAVWGQNARNLYFSQPAPDSFYSGDAGQVANIGLLRDYYSWTWGDALFVVIDPYWHSTNAVDNPLGG